MMTLDETAQAEARAKAEVDDALTYIADGVIKGIDRVGEKRRLAIYNDVSRLAATARTAIELLRQYDELHGSSTSHLSVDTKAFLAQVEKSVEADSEKLSGVREKHEAAQAWMKDRSVNAITPVGPYEGFIAGWQAAVAQKGGA